jgi:hypothetical protein
MEVLCTHCRKAKGALVCSKCTLGFYCSTECQGADWPDHKAHCKPLDYRFMPEFSKILAKITEKTIIADPITMEIIGISTEFAIANYIRCAHITKNENDYSTVILPWITFFARFGTTSEPMPEARSIIY